MHLNKISYLNIDTYLFNNINWFKDFFILKWYDKEDLKDKYILMFILTDFIQNKYLDKDINIIWNTEELDNILLILNSIASLWEEKLKELIIIWVIENYLNSNEIQMKKLKKILKYNNLVLWLDDLYKSWYKKELEITSNKDI